MKEHNILFTGEMVRAIIDNRKAMTRRVIKPQPANTPILTAQTRVGESCEWYDADCVNPGVLMKCPYGKRGDRLIVKEASWMFCERKPNGKTKIGRQKWLYVPLRAAQVHYCADRATKPTLDVVHPETKNKWVWKYKAARFMPRWAVRFNLEVTGIRAERVQVISEADVKAEGVNITDTLRTQIYEPHVWGFAALWDSINEERGYSWKVNPWVWVVEFRRVRP